MLNTSLMENWLVPSALASNYLADKTNTTIGVNNIAKSESHELYKPMTNNRWDTKATMSHKHAILSGRKRVFHFATYTTLLHCNETLLILGRQKIRCFTIRNTGWFDLAKSGVYSVA